MKSSSAPDLLILTGAAFRAAPRKAIRLSVYSSLAYAFEPYLDSQTGRVLREDMEYLRLTISSLDTSTILKRSVYHKLQEKMSPSEAKTCIRAVLGALGDAPPSGAAIELSPLQHRRAEQAAAIDRVQGTLKRFNIYFEWHEVQRLWSLVNNPRASRRGRGWPTPYSRPRGT